MNRSLQDRLDGIQERVTETKNMEVKTESQKETPIKTLEDFIDSKRINIYSRSWNKLEIKLKKNKLVEFIDKDIIKNNLDTNVGVKVKKILLRLLRRDRLNKVSEVSYDKQLCQIVSIKNLSYNEEKKCYLWKDEIIS